MTSDTRDRFVASLEQAMSKASGLPVEDVYALLGRARNWVEERDLLFFLATFQSRESLAAFLDSFPQQYEPYMLFAADLIVAVPDIFLQELNRIAHEFAKDHPLTKAGRPQAIPEDDKPSVVAFVGKLITQGSTAGVAQQRAAKHFNASLASVERVWRARKEYANHKPKTIAEVFELLRVTPILQPERP